MKNYSVQLEIIYPYLKAAKLDCYVLGMNFPNILIIPGGGYWGVADREGYPVALKFLNSGYNAFVLDYSTVDRTPDVKYPMQLMQALSAVRYIRENAEKNQTGKNVIVCGFSAGGHLAAMTLTMYNKKDILLAMNDKKADDFRPSAGVLCYPVISSGKYAHRDSFINLTGSKEQNVHDTVSPDRYIDKNTPPVFLWHTRDDNIVPVENSFIFAEKLKENNIPFALHIFESGEHGLSACNKISFNGNPGYIRRDIEKWAELCIDWLDAKFK